MSECCWIPYTPQSDFYDYWHEPMGSYSHLLLDLEPGGGFQEPSIGFLSQKMPYMTRRQSNIFNMFMHQFLYSGSN